jgi:cytosine/adenosine deaminase-related metal-dependent hydrolase
MWDIELEPWSLTARWVIPVDGPPLENGTVIVEGDEFVNLLPQGKCKADVDLGNVAILPGFVNAHTHLDLSGMRGKCPPMPDFTQWLRGVIAYRRRQTEEEIDATIEAGFKEGVAYGTTLFGDISAQSHSSLVLAALPARLVVFYEMLGLPKDRALQALEAVNDKLSHHRRSFTCRAGLSPHAPYSVHDLLFRSVVCSFGRYDRLPVAVHLAETAAELQLLETHSGPFAQFLSELGVWAEEGLIKSPAELTGLLGTKPDPLLLIHCNYLDPATPIPPNATIVYCPRTHAAFGHSPHPFREFLARGVRVALGTDSLASNPDLDVLAEARFVHRRYLDVPGSMILHMATLAGAEALGWADETGSITPGKSADLVVLPLPDVESAEPYSLILEADTRVRAVLFRGQWTVGHP